MQGVKNVTKQHENNAISGNLKVTISNSNKASFKESVTENVTFRHTLNFSTFFNQLKLSII